MRILLLNQAFYPDVVSSAQHLADLARGLIERGCEVTVVCGDRGYDDRRTRFPKDEVWKGISIKRVSSFGFGKGARWRRALDFGSFLFRAALKVTVEPRFDVVICLTSPPFISLLGVLFTRFRGGRLVLWVMDLNPDEAIAAGWLKPESLSAKILKAISRRTFRWSEKVIVLDRFMEERLLRDGVAGEKIRVIPPWAQDDSVRYDEEGRNRFRQEHGLAGKFIVMHSGNHSPCHPLDTLLQAARELADDAGVRFCFVGGGSEMKKVKAFKKAHNLENILCLPYQPMDSLPGSLSSADLHVVVMGGEFVGIVHPCKVYNILALGLPVLYIGPTSSHIEDLAARDSESSLWHRTRHGDAPSVVKEILAARQSREACSRRGSHAAYSKSILLPRLIEEAVFPPSSAAAASRSLDAPASVTR